MDCLGVGTEHIRRPQSGGGCYIIIRHRSTRCPAHCVLLRGDSYKRVSRQIAEGPGRWRVVRRTTSMF